MHNIVPVVRALHGQMYFERSGWQMQLLATQARPVRLQERSQRILFGWEKNGRVPRSPLHNLRPELIALGHS